MSDQDTVTNGAGQVPAGEAYRVLARKYRPASFDDLIGQEPMVRTLTNAFETGRIAQAWMLTGVRGVGKTTTARILARALNYETAEIHEPTIHMREPGIHDQAIMEGRHVDVVEMDAASHTGIDDIREIIAQVRYRPVSARYKVYIIDEVHMLSNQAFNGLLKTLEEPPEHVKFVFATTEIRKVPITVLSRCQRFDLRRVDAATLIRHLGKVAAAEKVEIDEEALRLLARAAEGSVRDALSLTDQAISHGAGRVEAAAVRDMLGLADRGRVIDLFEKLMRGDATAALAELRDQYNGGADPLVVLSDLADFTHLVTSLRFVPDSADDAALSPAESARGLEFSQKLSVRTLSQVWQLLLKAIEETRAATTPRQAAEMALIRIAYAADLPAPADLARLIAEGGDVPRSPSYPAPRDGASAATHAAGEAAPAAAAERSSSMPAAAPVAAMTGTPAMTGMTPPPRLAIAARGDSRMAAPAAAPATAMPEIRTIEGLVALAEEKRDSLMQASLRRYIRPVKIEPGRIEVALTEGAPRTLPGDLQRRLLEWTGRRWTVTISSAEGGRTIEETVAARRDALVSDAIADPEVAAILAQFPGAKVIDVRLRGEALAAEAATLTLSEAPRDADLADDMPIETDDDDDL
ncbi:DNA polymerase III subunit gamma/tau [Aureimonas glaciei]|uniref:DNA polymerase III subunit gamma/tau n=1 Tax=Aureimonas glaciei TaxID=1776957 RepID=A0A916XSU0_9HYPH|nr:DNA polymerase III subunit gamma/tau [Aureimonas glaciei]GGD05593.1 DNA polymerase III subunit gamma/tau [Aureimonas glaciei]